MRKILILIFIVLTITSCDKTSVGENEVNQSFPLSQFFAFSSKDEILKMAISDAWAVIQTRSELDAIDIATGKLIWEIPFSAGVNSEFSIMNDTFVTASHDQIIVINKSGQSRLVKIDPSDGNIGELVAVYENYVYVIRAPFWILEVYDISKDKMLWKTVAGRGGTDVFLDPNSSVVYVTTTTSVRAFDNKTGNLLWEQDAATLHSAFASGVLYLCEETNERYVFRFSAMKVDNQQKLWDETFSYNFDYVYRLTVIDNLLIASTRDGLIAIDKNNGKQIWQSAEGDIFYTSPVEFDGVIYAKGSSRKIYAISPNNGDILGYVRLEADSDIQSKYETLAGIFVLKNGIALNTNTTMVLFKTK